METNRVPILALHETAPTPEIARKVIEQIRSERGHIDETDEFEISKTSLEWQESYRQRQKKLRDVYARYTKTYALNYDGSLH